MSKPATCYARVYPGLSTLATLTNRGVNEYSNAGAHAKRQLHRNGMRFLNAIADELGLSERARSNKAGIAVSGEVTLHAADVWIQLSEAIGTKGVTLMWRRPLNAHDSVRWDHDGNNRFIRLGGAPNQVDRQITNMIRQFQAWIEESKS